MDYFIGVDPGKNGALAIVSEDLSYSIAFKFPCDLNEIKELIKSKPPTLICIERVGNPPNAMAIKSLAFSTGFWEGFFNACGDAVLEVPVRKWVDSVILQKDKKKKTRQKKKSSRESTRDKTPIVEWAKKMFPHIDLSLKKYEDKAEALALAVYGIRYLKGGLE